MSKPRDDWWETAKRMVRNYPSRRAEYEQLHSQSIAAPTSGVTKPGGTSRPVEKIALREMAPMKQAEYDAVTRAIEITRLLPDGERRIMLIELMYWRGEKLTIDDVVWRLHVAEATGKRWHRSFIRLVGECVGYIC